MAVATGEWGCSGDASLRIVVSTVGGRGFGAAALRAFDIVMVAVRLRALASESR